MMTSERIFIIGGTGNIGKPLVEELISKNVKLTLFARNPGKVATLFPTGDITTVEGDLSDLTPLKDAVRGHTRLFFTINDMFSMEETKGTIAKYAYAAGVKQIVDVSSLTAGYPWRISYGGELHASGEKAVLSIPNRGRFVALRPGRFMSNMTSFDRVHPDDVVRDTHSPDECMTWISPNDVAAVAAAVLTEDIEKHCDAVYELIGDRATSNERVEILSRILGKKITYSQIDVTTRYNQLMKHGLSHGFAYDLACSSVTTPAEGNITTGFPILIGRKPETLEEYAIKNKEFLQIK